MKCRDCDRRARPFHVYCPDCEAAHLAAAYNSRTPVWIRRAHERGLAKDLSGWTEPELRAAWGDR
jgi:hypothetical protein